MTGLLNVFIYWPGRHNLWPKGRGFSGKIIERRSHQGTSHLPSKHSSWWRRLEDVLKTSFVFVFRRRLDQDEYVRLSLTSSEDVLVKTNIFVLAICLQDVFKTSSRHLQDVFKTSSRRLAKMSTRRFQDVFKTSCKNVFKTSSRRL